ncbi:hypothetical protein K435DRAFT_800494 [Dendrothele bispora CBS 962.96]|uniref:Uncharacterized protein n=1 Tax=Dendrothele bispora (strain CBS 962.96) TaxID=1314807 RepID=A0A4S8LT06_DENBC|nr:hypothetical protein K435DRAFT_800494 [Dendrothele bispora CBS 962.96]
MATAIPQDWPEIGRLSGIKSGQHEDNEAWFDLPLPYISAPIFSHEPPKFVYGFGFGYNELLVLDHTARELAPPPEKLRFGDHLDAWCTAVDHLIECGLKGLPVRMFTDVPVSKQTDMILIVFLTCKKKMTWKKEGFPSDQCGGFLEKNRFHGDRLPCFFRITKILSSILFFTQFDWRCTACKGSGSMRGLELKKKAKGELLSVDEYYPNDNETYEAENETGNEQPVVLFASDSGESEDEDEIEVEVDREEKVSA